MSEEIDRIKKHYSEREKFGVDQKLGKHTIYNRFKRKERDKVISEIIISNFESTENLCVLEIGAGKGGNLNLFRDLGIPWKNIRANDLLEENRAHLGKYLPVENIHIGTATDLQINDKFDIVFQSLVFTSVLDENIRYSLAAKMKELCSEDGLIVWYDFAYNNPANDQVRGIGKKLINDLFKEARSIYFTRVTLAPPIGRIVGRMYSLFNFMSFLRTHLIAVIRM